MERNDPGIFITGDGSHSIISDKFKESYHSRHGALQESRHVFIDAGLKSAIPQPLLKIFELGFGTGLNAWLSQLESSAQQSIHYTGIEAYPISIEQVQDLNYPLLTHPNDPEMAMQLFKDLHTQPWGAVLQLTDHFSFLKEQVTLADFQPTEQFHVCYFDAFAPNAQPELWTDAVFTKIYNLLTPGGRMVTYCAKGSVKRSLKAVGFTVETLPGPPGKREMTRAVKPLV